jgi:hypothetical protein
MAREEWPVTELGGVYVIGTSSLTSTGAPLASFIT